MVRLLLNIFLSFLGFGTFMYLTLLSTYRMYFDYDRNMIRTSVCFCIASIGAVLVSRNFLTIFNTSHLVYALCMSITTIGIVFFFSSWWQINGKHLMPTLPIRAEMVTLYDFSQRYAATKFFEVLFQNTLAYILVVSVYAYVQDIILTIVLFMLTFFISHLLTFSFFGTQWKIFMGIMAPVGGFVVVVGYLLVPNGMIYVTCFHILMYILFLLIVRRIQLQKIALMTL